jgi:alkylhydroperoxidase family enzyme
MSLPFSNSDTPIPDIPIPEDIRSWYRNRFKPTKLGRVLGSVFGAPLQNPRIFAVLESRKAYKYAAIDAWRRAMWHTGGLERRTREAIAVAVSSANHCLY